MTPITFKARVRYMRWLGYLMQLQNACDTVDRTKDPVRKMAARMNMLAATRRIDALKLPESWSSWDELGRAIDANRKISAVGERLQLDS